MVQQYNPTVSTNLTRQFQQLDAMLGVILPRCRGDEAKIQRWYIERKRYDFVMYDGKGSDVVELTRDSDALSNLESGARIVMRVINEVEDPTLNAEYKCPCGKLNTIKVSIGSLLDALKHGCTIIWFVSRCCCDLPE